MLLSILNPSFGVIFWMMLSFTFVFLVLKKYGWSSILQGLKHREETITDALNAASKAREDMKSLEANNKQMIHESKLEKSRMIEETSILKEHILAEARDKANSEADRILESAKKSIQNERLEAAKELKKEIAVKSIEIAEKILRSELDNKEKHEKLVSKLVDNVKLN